jgi:hypothetical protein
MTQIAIDLSKRYAAAFGLLAVNNKPGTAYVDENEGVYRLSFYDQIDADFESVKFIYETTEINFSALPFLKGNTELGNILAPPPLISFSRQKQHIETPVNDSDNIVVERWGTKPWEIRIRGLLIDVENRHYPEKRVKELTKLFEYNGVLEVSGTQFLDKGIESIYFKDIEINGVQGYQDTVQFSLQARSISPVEFTLSNP